MKILTILRSNFFFINLDFCFLAEAGPPVRTRSWTTKIFLRSLSKSATSLACRGSLRSLSTITKKTAFLLISWPLLRQTPASEITLMPYRQLIGKISKYISGLYVCLVWFFMSLSTFFSLVGLSGEVFLGWTSFKQRIKCLSQGHNTVLLVRLKPATPQFRVKHSTTEPLCSPKWICHVSVAK